MVSRPTQVRAFGGARKSFPNAPGYEPKLNPGMILHLAVYGEGKIIEEGNLPITCLGTLCCTSFSFRTVAVTEEDTRCTEDPASVHWGWSAHSSQQDGDNTRRC